MMFHGLGAWPTDPYYDPDRPAWLPYWIDDLTESRNKAAYALSTGAAGPIGIAVAPSVSTPTGAGPYTNPPAPVTVQPPDMTTDPTGQGLSIDAQLAAQQAAQQQALQTWSNAQSAATPVDNTSVGAFLNTLGGGSLLSSTSWWYQYGPYVLVGGAALAVYAMTTKSRQ
jgi:hypothetical protein